MSSSMLCPQFSLFAKLWLFLSGFAESKTLEDLLGVSAGVAQLKADAIYAALDALLFLKSSAE